MPDDYDFRAAVCWASQWLSQGELVYQILERNARRQPPIPDDLLRGAIPTAMRACENARIVRSAPGNVRLCDLPGCVFPQEG